MTYDLIPPFNPVISEYRDLPDRSTPVLAREINGWNDRLSLLTDAVNAAGAEVNNLGGSLGALGAPAEAGSLLVSNGASFVSIPPGHPDSVLVRDTNAPEGLAWRYVQGAQLAASDVFTVPLRGNSSPSVSKLLLAPTMDSLNFYRGSDGWLRITRTNFVDQAANGRHFKGVDFPPMRSWSAGETARAVIANLPPALRPSVDRSALLEPGNSKVVSERNSGNNEYFGRPFTSVSVNVKVNGDVEISCTAQSAVTGSIYPTGQLAFSPETPIVNIQ